MEEGKEPWDSSYQKQYHGGNYLYKEIFQYGILWRDLGLKWKLNQCRGDWYCSNELAKLLAGDNQMQK